jgi:hypothetical protein
MLGCGGAFSLFRPRRKNALARHMPPRRDRESGQKRVRYEHREDEEEEEEENVMSV